MSFIATVSEEQAEGPVADMYEADRAALGYVPDLRASNIAVQQGQRDGSSGHCSRRPCCEAVSPTAANGRAWCWSETLVGHYRPGPSSHNRARLPGKSLVIRGLVHRRGLRFRVTPL